MTIKFYNSEDSGFHRKKNKEVETWFQPEFMPRIGETYNFKGSRWKIIEVRWLNQFEVEIFME